jgi:hypothetical protein
MPRGRLRCAAARDVILKVEVRDPGCGVTINSGILRAW